MRRLLPRTLISQMILILLAGLVVSHLVAGWIYTSDRVRAVRTIGVQTAAQRIANLVRLIDEAPAEWRSRIIATAIDPRIRLTLTTEPPRPPDWAEDAPDPPIRTYLAELLPASVAERLVVAVIGPPPVPAAAQPRPGRSGRRHMEAEAMGPGPGRRLLVAAPLSDGSWLTVTLGLPPDPPPPLSARFLVPMGIMAVIVILACIWAVRRVSAPLATVTRAAERFGRDVEAPPIPETGTREMRQAARAFNDMQARLQRLLRNRTTMLAALSHDLRTPLTLLRLRVEALPEGEERERMLGNLATLEAMVSATLAYARDSTAPEVWRRTDLAALVGSIVDDMADAGLPVSLQVGEAVVLECQPQALRRLVTNLIENAVKYGDRARVSLTRLGGEARITVDDDGPGIPEAAQERVFEPFFRLDPSRSRDTGGAGLGLAIAQAIAEGHDGRITLANRPEGGLRVTVTLPIRAATVPTRGRRVAAVDGTATAVA